MSREIPFTFDGTEMVAREEGSIAEALIGNGVLAWRSTRFGDRPRGLFCGIGACYDCLIAVNGEPNVRACLAPLEPGDELRTQRGDGHVG